VNKISVSFRNQPWETEEVVKRLIGQLNSGFSEWEKTRDDFAEERQKLEKERKDLT
jgi:hypothetical protein